MANARISKQPATREWVERYLALLDLPAEPPSLPALDRLTRAQILTIAFENLTSQVRRRSRPDGPVPELDLDRLLTDWEEGRSGGVCFELAPMFGRLLESLGYDVTLILAQISFPASHNALLVKLDGNRYLVDVSNGAPFFEPIPLDTTTEVRFAGLAYRFRPGDQPDEWVQDRLIHDEWTPFCRYDLRPAQEADRAAGFQLHHTPGNSWVVDRIRMIRCREHDVVAVMDDEITFFLEDGKYSERITDIAAFEYVATNAFGLPRAPIAEIVRARSFGR